MTSSADEAATASELSAVNVAVWEMPPMAASPRPLSGHADGAASAAQKTYSLRSRVNSPSPVMISAMRADTDHVPRSACGFAA